MSQELLLMFFGGVAFGLGISAGLEPLHLKKCLVMIYGWTKTKIKEGFAKMSNDESNVAKPVMPVARIQLQMNGLSFVFRPLDDITPKEVAFIFQMFLNGIIAGSKIIDFEAYINENNLSRHFEIVEEPSNKETS